METNLDSIHKQVIACRKCPRLVAWREQVAREKRRAFLQEEYWGKPVPGFGDPLAKIMVVGLAPGAHGSNRTGRMFTGDASGEFLYRALYLAGFANQSTSIEVGDGLTLNEIYISAVCRCVPPQNKPTPQEIRNCLGYLEKELDLLPVQGIIALGKIAYDEVVRWADLRKYYPTEEIQFAHGRFNPSVEGKPWVLASYHPSRQNTQTGRLTREMFQSIWIQAHNLLG